MLFRDGIHKHNYYVYLQADRVSENDLERKALFYLLALTEETRKNIHQLYDFENHYINFEGMQQSWQTSGSKIICKLAFNLYNNYRGEGDDSCYYITPTDLFYNDELRPYMIEALKLRYNDIK